MIKKIPEWTKKPPAPGSYRSIFKYGDPNEFKHPGAKWYRMLKEELNMSDDDFKVKQFEGGEQVELKRPIKLTEEQINKFKSLVGEENVAFDDYSRVKYGYGKTMEETMELRRGIVREVPDIVIHPRDKQDVREIVEYCNHQKIPIYVYGGGSSVTFGLRPARGGVTLVMGTHMNRVLEINAVNQSVRVQPGIMGPAYETILNKEKFSCGHFPQSFEYSSVGGWILTLGAGQASTYYGDAYDIVLSQEHVTPAGCFKTFDYPGTATGPKANDIMKGSEGAFGILVEATMKIFKYMPENRKRFSFMFPSWEAAVNACREISQGEFGLPAVLRISDPEETEVGLKLYGIHGTLLDKLLTLLGYKPMLRSLCLGTVEGEKDFTKNVKKKIKRICKKYKAIYLTGYAAKLWGEGRYKDPYLREDLNDFGIIIETLESAVTWDNLHHLHQGVRGFIKNRPNTICTTHASHFYPQGTNLYFIFIGKFKDLDEYKEFHSGIVDQILKGGGSLSHHHGVGKLFAPWLEKHLGREQMDILRALKKHFDPNNIMNPGGQLGLDYE